MLSTKLKAAAGNSADATLYVDDVFSTYLYTGNNSTQNINNGIDLAGKGGMVWQRSRTSAQDNHLWDTARGANYDLVSNSNVGQYNRGGTNGVTSFNSNGFTITGAQGDFNASSDTYASWTFRKAAKFFDVVTYTGNGNGAGQIINHNLSVVPGLIICKSTSASGDWAVCSRTGGAASPASSITYATGMSLNSTAAALYSGSLGAYPTATTFSTAGIFDAASGGTYPNVNGVTYVAYLFAHDTDANGIIQCGSYTGNGSISAGPVVSLGWEPQYLMVKNAGGAGQWYIWDTMRGFPVGGKDAILLANAANAESTTVNYVDISATGFQIKDDNAAVNTNGSLYIYMAIRRPNKPPTSGTQVFSPLYSASPASTVQTTSFPVDMQIARYRSAGIGSFVMDRLRGVNSVVTTTVGTPYVKTNTAGSEVATTNLTNYWSNTGFSISGYLANAGSSYYNFKRAPGFFDEICYTGSVSYQDLSHNLGAVPELVIIKTRSGGFDWTVGLQGITGTGKYLVLNSTAGVVSNINYFGSTWTSTKVLVDGNVNAINQNLYTYVMYLFATLAGISKVGSYTGNGTGQAIACGFGAAGARFVLIKRTDSTGDWYTYDSVSGLTSGSSPYVLLNSTAAETTGNNGVYASTGGFTLGSTASTTTNINAATYIFLAVA